MRCIGLRAHQVDRRSAAATAGRSSPPCAAVLAGHARQHRRIVRDPDLIAVDRRLGSPAGHSRAPVGRSRCRADCSRSASWVFAPPSSAFARSTASLAACTTRRSATIRWRISSTSAPRPATSGGRRHRPSGCSRPRRPAVRVRPVARPGCDRQAKQDGEMNPATTTTMPGRDQGPHDAMT